MAGVMPPTKNELEAYPPFLALHQHEQVWLLNGVKMGYLNEMGHPSDGKYPPNGARWWTKLNRDGKMHYWLDSAVAHCHRYIDWNVPGQPEPVDLDTWIAQADHRKYLCPDKSRLEPANPNGYPTGNGVGRHALRGQHAGPSSSSTSIRSHREAARPYPSKPANDDYSQEKATAEAIARVKSRLVPIRPKTPGGLDRTLMLSFFQPGNFSRLIYVETEIMADMPYGIVKALKNDEARIRKSDSIILWGFQNPIPGTNSTMSRRPALTQPGNPTVPSTSAAPKSNTSQDPAIRHLPRAHNPYLPPTRTPPVADQLQSDAPSTVRVTAASPEYPNPNPAAVSTDSNMPMRESIPTQSANLAPPLVTPKRDYTAAAHAQGAPVLSKTSSPARVHENPTPLPANPIAPKANQTPRLAKKSLAPVTRTQSGITSTAALLGNINLNPSLSRESSLHEPPVPARSSNLATSSAFVARNSPVVKSRTTAPGSGSTSTSTPRPENARPTSHRMNPDVQKSNEIVKTPAPRTTSPHPATSKVQAEVGQPAPETTNITGPPCPTTTDGITQEAGPSQIQNIHTGDQAPPQAHVAQCSLAHGPASQEEITQSDWDALFGPSQEVDPEQGDSSGDIQIIGVSGVAPASQVTVPDGVAACQSPPDIPWNTPPPAPFGFNLRLPSL